ncbi:PLP-dependent aminotransferase family protein [Pendulispora rubella]|uniref:PLP-dependent aminotransferase family protein n=1 Tax=Pendulispora rubella TaxID=2741070 RepID=A0ABZ2LBC6_9BACT
MDLPIILDERTGRLALQVTASLRDAIRQRRLAVGARLPSTRALATDLGVSRGVIVEAYEQLTAEGYLETRRGSGTRVACKSSTESVAPRRKLVPDVGGGWEPDRAIPFRYDFRFSTPDLSTFPRGRWLWAIRHALATVAHADLGYVNPCGVVALRDEITAYLRRVNAAVCNVEEVAVVAGVAQSFVVALRLLSRRGCKRLAVEDPSGHRSRGLLENCAYSLIGVPVDEEGIRVDMLERTDADAVLVTPAHQFPTGVVLSPRRRAELVQWARRRNTFILEDNYDAEFRYDREPVGCIQGLAPDRVFLAGSVSKSLAPALRLGWLVVPTGPFSDECCAERSFLDLGSPVLDQYALAHLLATGTYDRHLRAVRRRYRARRDALVGALQQYLPSWRIHGVAAGLHLYVELPKGTDARAIVDCAAHASIGLESIDSMRLAHPSPPALVLGYARLSEEELSTAIKLLARHVAKTK